jgi:hypothetical protein
MVAFFRYSKIRYSRRIALAGAAGLQFAGIVSVTIVFQILSSWFGKQAQFHGHMITCLIGVTIGFLFIAFSRTPTDRRIGVLGASSIGFSLLYWFASSSPPDLWLAQIIAGFGIGALTAATYRWWFLEAPVIPRVA